MEENELSFNSTVDFASLFLNGLDHEMENTPKPVNSDILDAQHTNFLLEVNPNHMLPMHPLSRMGSLGDFGLPSLEIPMSMDQEMQNTHMRESMLSLHGLQNPLHTQEPDLGLGFSYLDVLKQPERSHSVPHELTPSLRSQEAQECHAEFGQLQELGAATTSTLPNSLEVSDKIMLPAKIPRRRKTANDKDPSTAKKKLPKAALTPYLCYVNERKPYYKSTFPNMPLKEVVSAIGREWSGLDPLAKKPYEERAGQDKKRYAEDVRVLKANIEQDSCDIRSTDKPDDHVAVPLFCSACQTHFSNAHNQAEHMNGRAHLEAVRTRKMLGLQISNKTRIEELMDSLKDSVSTRNMEIAKLNEKKDYLHSTQTTLNQTLASLQEKDRKLHEELKMLNRTSPRLTTTIKNLMNATKNLKTQVGVHSNVTG